MGSKNNAGVEKKAFRPTPARFKNSIKILAGTKTNATIRDIEEDKEKELEEMTGTVIEIDRNKINGDGWKVKGSDGNIYQCSCASNMYEIPDSVTRGGVLYPNGSTTVKFTVSKVLRRNSITEFLSGDGIEANDVTQKDKTPVGNQKKNDKNNSNNSSNDGNTDDEGEDEPSTKGTLSVADWQHGDKATTVIAKPKAAISISDGLISFNYNNTNAVLADNVSTKIIGEATEINTNTIDINSNNITVNGKTIEQKMAEKTQSIIDQNAKVYSYNSTSKENIDKNKIFIDKERNTVQITINDLNLKLTNKERVIMDIKDQKFFPLRNQSYIVIGNPIGTDIVTAYTDGIITCKTNDVMQNTEEPVKTDINKIISATQVWLSPQYNLQNTISINNPSHCPCCRNKNKTLSIFFNFCPICNEWHLLYNYANHIKCVKCQKVFCGSCGHALDVKCSNSLATLYSYEDNKISSETSLCDHCKNNNTIGNTKVYANYCPSCKKWKYLIVKDKNEQKIFYCGYCGHSFCSSCGMDLKNEVIESFDTTIYYYDDYIKKYQKMFFVKQE